MTFLDPHHGSGGVTVPTAWWVVRARVASTSRSHPTRLPAHLGSMTFANVEACECVFGCYWYEATSINQAIRWLSLRAYAFTKPWRHGLWPYMQLVHSVVARLARNRSEERTGAVEARAASRHAPAVSRMQREADTRPTHTRPIPNKALDKTNGPRYVARHTGICARARRQGDAPLERAQAKVGAKAVSATAHRNERRGTPMRNAALRRSQLYDSK